VRQERLELCGLHAGRMALAVKQDEAPRLEHALLFRAVAAMQGAQVVAHLVQQSGPGVHAGMPSIAN
jgi:hypothetical protein